MTPESHRIRIVDDIIWYDIWKGVLTQRLRDDDVLEYLLDDLSSAGLSTEDIKSYSWIVNAGWEGYSAEDIEHFRKLLIKHGLPETRFGAVFIAYEDIDKLPYPAICFPDRMIYLGNWYNGLKKQNVDWLNMPMTSSFTVLMRRASESRCHLAKKLLQQFDARQMIMTLGTNPGTAVADNTQIQFSFGTEGSGIVGYNASLPVVMRANPTTTVYDGDGNSGKVDILSSGAGVTHNQATNVVNGRAEFINVRIFGKTCAGMAFHYEVDAEL